MDTTQAIEPGHAMDDATAERTSEREIVVARTVNGPAHLVFDAWTKAELLERWWVPQSFPITLLSCETDPRVGGRYKLVFAFEGATAEFFGRYLEVTPSSRLSWTNEEGGGETITTVTFEEQGGRTHVVVHERYPSKDALDEAIASGASGMSAMPESLAQLDELLATPA